MDYLPASDSAFAAWLTNFSTLITANPTDFGLLAGDAVIIAGVEATFVADLLLATDPITRTSVTVAQKDASRAAATAVVRPYAVRISLNQSVTNGDKTAVGVTVRDTVPTPIPAPVVPPVISMLSALPLVMQLQIKPLGSSTKAKPFGAIAIEVARDIGTVPAIDPDQMPIVGQFGKTPLIQSFMSADQGKIVTFAARYRTRSGPGGVSQAGPWSALTSFVVI